MHVKICSVVGTRPHLTKLASIAAAFDQAEVVHDIVHSGQHYDPELVDNFLDPLRLPSFACRLSAGRKPTSNQYAYLIAELPQVFSRLEPDLVLVYGDTTTTAAAAIAAAVGKIPVAHVEAGLREFDLSIPEEVNKRLVDGVSSLFLCPSERAAAQLRHEGITEGIVITGDTALDLLERDPPPAALAWVEANQLRTRRYALCTVHRAANTEDFRRLEAIVGGLDALRAQNLKVLAPLHPRTRQALTRFRISLPENVEVVPPAGFFELQQAVRHAQCVITDSGGITKEAYQQRRLVVLVDDQTEWTEAVDEGWVRIVGADTQAIASAVADSRLPLTHTKPYGRGDAGRSVVRACLNYLDRYGSRQPRTRLSAPYRRR